MMCYDSVDSIKKLLPKTYCQRKHVALEVHAAISHFKDLVPNMENYVFNDGTTDYLLSLSGTIPVIYGDTTYNIPVCLWLEQSYPQTAPLCYVKPTREMIVLKGTYIDSNGEITLPYLQEWNHDNCDLVSLLQVMSAMFGECPPVCVHGPPPPEPEQASCSVEFLRQAEGLDGDSCLLLNRDDEQPFNGENETHC